MKVRAVDDVIRSKMQRISGVWGWTDGWTVGREEARGGEPAAVVACPQVHQRGGRDGLRASSSSSMSSSTSARRSGWTESEAEQGLTSNCSAMASRRSAVKAAMPFSIPSSREYETFKVRSNIILTVLLRKKPPLGEDARTCASGWRSEERAGRSALIMD